MSQTSVLPRRRRFPRVLVPTAIVGIVAVAALGRFVFYDDSAPPALERGGASASADSIPSLEAVATASPDDAGAWQELATAYVTAIIQGDPSYSPQAIEALDRAEALAPGDPTTQVVRGVLHLSLHQFADAERLARAALAVRPDNRDALAVLVDAQVELGQYDQAASTLQTLLDLRPSLAALSRASYLRELHGDLPGAIVAMQQAQAASGSAFDTANVTTYLGDILLTDGRPEQAAVQYQRALEFVPGLVGADLGLARAQLATGDVTGAVARLEALLERSPQFGAATLLGDLYMSAGRHDDAGAAYALVDEGLALERANGSIVYLEIAVFKADHGDLQGSLAAAETAYEERQTVLTADALAWALHRNGSSTEALRYTEEALRLGTVDPHILFHAAAIHHATGDDDRARAEIERAAPSTPSLSPLVVAEIDALAKELGVR